MPPPVIVLFAKRPDRGKVKTRLVPPLTPDQAAHLYHCFLKDACGQLLTLRDVDRVIAYDPPEAGDFFESWRPHGWTPLPQPQTGLGDRMAGLFAALHDQGYRQFLAVGSDAPTLPTAWLQQAIDVLRRNATSLVLGPTEDGGYYLIGMNGLQTEVFDDIAWSTDRVYTQTKARAAALKLTVTDLPRWYDVDDAASLEKMRQSLAGSEFRHDPRHTRNYLAELSNLTAPRFPAAPLE